MSKGSERRHARRLFVIATVVGAVLAVGTLRVADAVHAAPPLELSKHPLVIAAHGVRTLKLRDLAARRAPAGEKGEAADEQFINAVLPGFPTSATDPVVQTHTTRETPAPTSSFDGIDYGVNSCNCAPPDTNAEVGKTQIAEMVNTALAVYSKTGTQLLAPTAIGNLWPVSEPACHLNNDGDPVVLYDQLADRWVISQFAFATVGGSPVPPFHECVAVSTSGDATGSWTAYDFTMSNTLFPDYPKLGLWSDGSAAHSSYLMTLNTFASPSFSYSGAAAVAFERAAMLAGSLTAHVVIFDTSSSSGSWLASHFGQLPADLSGSDVAPSGETAPFAEMSDDTNALELFRLNVDWTNPSAATYGADSTLPVAGFSSVLCGATRGQCVPQSDTTNALEALSDRLMFRADYRNLHGTEHLLLTHTVNSAGFGTAPGAIRWYDLTKASGAGTAFAVGQQSTYAPDSTYRWMPSIAMDEIGDVAVGYSGSSGSIHPDIRYAGRLWNDPASTLEGEQTLFTGAGSQTGTLHRWGDYSDLTVDPSDNCTFWFATEYIPTDGSFNWHTRIGSFRFPQCVASVTSFSPASGGPGTSVTINGTGFDAGKMTVKFGGVASTSVNVVSPLQLTAAVPSGAVTGPIAVSGPTGSASTTTSFTVTGSSPRTLTVSTSGSGTVTSSPAGINCGTACSADFPSGTSVTLTETAASGFTFAGWGGACTGTGSCAVTMDAAKSVSAAFAAVPPPPPPPPPPASPPPPPPPPASPPPPPPPPPVKKPPVKLVTMCFHKHTIKVKKTKVAALKKKGAKLGACRKTKKKK